MAVVAFYRRPRRRPTSPRRADALGSLFREQRIRQGLRLRDVAERTGLAVRRLSLLERGLRVAADGDPSGCGGARGGRGVSEAPRPVTFLDVRPEGLAPELRALPFVLWRAQPQGDGVKPAKVPYQIADPERHASSTDPTTWGSFADAVEAYVLLDGAHKAHPTRGPIVGIGVVLTAVAGIVCVDLDRVVDGEILDPRAARLVHAFNSWTERSPSGTGLHVFVRGRLPKAIKGDQIEVYGDARYIAVTGHRWPGTPAEVHERQALLDRLSAADAPPPRPAWTGPSTPPPDDLGGALLAKVRAWDLPVVAPLKRWQDGFLLELASCPWAAEHSTGPGGAAVLIRASGAFDFTCLHAHCAARGWRDLRAVIESTRR